MEVPGTLPAEEEAADQAEVTAVTPAAGASMEVRAPEGTLVSVSPSPLLRNNRCLVRAVHDSIDSILLRIMDYDRSIHTINIYIYTCKEVKEEELVRRSLEGLIPEATNTIYQDPLTGRPYNEKGERCDGLGQTNRSLIDH